MRSHPEIGYSILRYLVSVVKIYPDVVGEDYGHFICDYNDPFYIKIEKMEIMFVMANKRNAKKILDEFYEYHKEINSEFVKQAINYMYRIALKVRTEAPHALVLYQKILENLHESSEHTNHIAIGTAVIIRAFPKVKGGTDIVKAISKVHKSLQDQEAKVAFIWLLGEYCEKIEGSGPILEYFSNNFFSQTSPV
jgi:vesicle coat complex subunit